MRRIFCLLVVFIICACATSPSVPSNVVQTNNAIIKSERVKKERPNEILSEHGYIQSGTYFFKLYEENDGLFYYVFNLENDYFTLINAYTGENYATKISENTDSYMDLILDDELDEVGLMRKNFNPIKSEKETILLGEFQLKREFKNVYQILMSHGYKNENGYLIKEYDFGKVAFNLNQATITAYLNGSEEYYQYNPNYVYHKYTYLDGECSYSKYDEDMNNNCTTYDTDCITVIYEDFIDEVLDELGLELIDLEVYLKEMQGKELSIYNSYPSLNKNIVNMDREIANYVRNSFTYYGAKIRETSIEISYRGKNAMFFFEDKTFMYGYNGAVYEWKSDVAKVGKCIYDYNSKIGCSDSEVEAAEETKRAFYGALDYYGFNTKELHQYANSLHIYNITLGGVNNVE